MKKPKKIEQLNLWEMFFGSYDYEDTFTRRERTVLGEMSDKINEVIEEIEKLKSWQRDYQGCGKCRGG